MFPAGVFLLLVALLDPRSGEVSRVMLDGMNYYQCSNFKMYFDDHPLRKMNDGSNRVVVSVECLKEING